MKRIAARCVAGVAGLCLLAGPAWAQDGPARFRKPAPLEDGEQLIPTPVFGRAAGHVDPERQLSVFEWVAKRTWHHLGLPYERKDRVGPPNMKGVTFKDNTATINETVVCGGMPLRNQIITADVEQHDAPILILLRSADAFGELLIELDLRGGTAKARSVTINRTMIGGQSHSSPMPEESCAAPVASTKFGPMSDGWHSLKIETRGAIVRVVVDDAPVLAFDDPDPAGGLFGFGSTGTVGVRGLDQAELISRAEQARREACLKDMHEFCKGLDAEYEGDVRRRNQLEVSDGAAKWTWPATGATVSFRVDGPAVRGVVGAGLYGNDTLLDGAFPEVVVIAKDGAAFRGDPKGRARIEGDATGVTMTLPLRDPAGRTATARVRAAFTVVTVWFWTIDVEGVEPKYVQAFLPLAGEFRMHPSDKAGDVPNLVITAKPVTSHLTHNAKAGLFIKAIEPEHTQMATQLGESGALALSTTDARLRFATVILPAQPLNLVGFDRRMVHYIRYPEGPVQHWRRRPSYQEYPAYVDLLRYKAAGTDAMVWHHTWLNTDFYDREAFLLNEPEMKRAMQQTHDLGMTAVGYIGIVPGRSSLLRYEDTGSYNAADPYGGYAKNWDLQDFTFYHVAGRIQEFIPWMTDYWCREYGLDGFYLDGGLAFASRGALPPLHPKDKDLSVDELMHRMYYRVRKVFERNRAGFGIEVWGGHNWMLVGFYDCQMIGESFQEAPPEQYREQYNALLTGTTFKMYGMRESSQNPYNIAMAGVCMSDIQVCSGNGAWGDVFDTTETWARVRPYWDLMKTVNWHRLLDARPWYAQELVGGEGFYAANYTEPDRTLIFLANRTETPGTFDVKIDAKRLPRNDGVWQVQYVYGRKGEIGVLDETKPLRIELPALHEGPIGIELVARP